MSIQPTLQPGVQRVIDDPCPGEEVRLLVDYDGDEERVVRLVERSGATVNKSLIRNTLSISVGQKDVSEVCELSPITYVEVEDQLELMDEGSSGDTNFR